MELEYGRPADWEKRASREIRVYDLLDSLGISYARVDHDAFYTMEAGKEAEEALGTRICKNLFLCNSQRTKYYLLLMPGDKKFRTRELSSQIRSARLSFARPEDMENLLDLTPGSVSVLGLMNDRKMQVQLLADEDILKEQKFGCHPCVNTSSLSFATSDLLEKILPALRHPCRTVRLTGEDLV